MSVPKFAVRASFRNVCVSIFNYNQSLDQHPVRAGEKFCPTPHNLEDIGREKQWFDNNHAHFVYSLLRH